MHIGLIGGIGPAATDYYYQSLIAAFASRQESLDMTIVHADAPTLISNLEQDNKEAQVAIYSKLTDRLVAAGAQCVVVTSIAGHFCIETFKEVSPLLVVDMLTVVDNAISERKLNRVGIIGTRTVMESKFYSGISTANVIPPSGSALDDVHSAYITMATTGRVTSSQRAVFDSACEQLIQEEKVDAIILGGTDLALVYGEGEHGFPIVDCAAIHVDAVVKTAIGDDVRPTPA